MTSTTPADFAIAFRKQATAGVEYSYDLAPGRIGITVPGGPGFGVAVEQFTGDLPFAEDWTWAMRHFVAYVVPDAFLLRIDCYSEEITAVTLYCRFPNEPDDAAFAAAVARLRPMRWVGPPPSKAASILGVSGPRGIGLRVNNRGDHTTSLYYKLEALLNEMPATTLPELARICGLPPDIAKSVSEDIRPLYTPGLVGVIGVNSAEDGHSNSIKFNPANVPLALAFAFIGRKGATEVRVAALAKTAQSLRALGASYLGVKYDHAGFAGWRLYFSVQPSLNSSPRDTQLLMERSRLPTLRLPHY